MQKVIIQTRRKSIIVSLRSRFMNPKLLVFAVVLAVLFVTIGVSMSSTQDSSHNDTGGTGFLADVYTQWFQGPTTRPSFLVVPVFDQEARSSPWFLLSFYEMYPEARMPEEFLPTSIERDGIYEGHKWPHDSLYPSLLLTMAYQQGYQIETVTDSYIILVKSVKIESEEKGEE